MKRIESQEVTVTAPLWPTMLPLLTGILCGALGVSMVNTALPQIAADLRLNEANRAWVVDAYPLTTAVTIVLAARLGDRFGRRRIFVVGTIGYGLFALLAALSSAALPLIIARVLMGASSALIIASVVSTIGTLFTGKNLVMANGLWVAVFGLGSSLGPLLGGVLTEAWGWQAVFFACVPLALAAMTLSLFCLTETTAPAAGAFDLLSVLTSALAIGAFAYGVKQVSGSWIFGALWIIGGVLVLLYFIRRQRRLKAPLIAVDLFTHARFTSAALQILISAGTSTAAIYLLSIHLQNESGFSPAAAGLALTPQAVATILGGLIAPRVAGWIGKPAAITTALIVQAAGLAWLGFSPDFSVLALIGIGLGFGFAGALSTTTLFESAPRDSAGQVGAIQEVVFALGSGCGIAVFATIALFDDSFGFTISLLVAGAFTFLIAPTAFFRDKAFFRDTRNTISSTSRAAEN